VKLSQARPAHASLERHKLGLLNWVSDLAVAMVTGVVTSTAPYRRLNARLKVSLGRRGLIKSQLVWADDVTKSGGAPAQSCIEGDKPAFEQPS
jgi:hypothetical protein